MRVRHGSLGLLTTVLMAVLATGAATPLTNPATAAALPASSSSCPASTSRISVTCDESAFLAGGEVAARETFEQPRAFDPARKVVPFSEMKFVSWGTSRPYWTVDNAGTDNGKLYRKFTDGSDNLNASVYFAGRGSVERFGFLLHPFGTPNQFVVRVISVDGSTSDLWLARDTGDVYLGLSSAVGMKKVKVIQMAYRANGSSTNFAFDDVSRGAITPAS